MFLRTGRVQKELQLAQLKPPPGCAAWAEDKDLTKIQGSIDVCINYSPVNFPKVDFSGS